MNGTAQILSSTDTLVPEAEVQPMVEVSQLTQVKSKPVVAEVPVRLQLRSRPVLVTELSMPASLFSDPLDTDGLVAHQDQVQRRMVEIFSSHQAEVNALRRDLHMSRLALTQAGLRPEQILEETQDVMLDGRSGVDSTASEVSLG